MLSFYLDLPKGVAIIERKQCFRFIVIVQVLIYRRLVELSQYFYIR